MRSSGSDPETAETVDASALDPISGLYTTVPSFRVRPETSVRFDITRNEYVSRAIFRYFPLLAAAAVIILAAGSVLGWVTDLDVLRGNLAGLAPMKPTTAGGLFLCGASLFLLADGFPINHRFAYRIAGKTAAALGAFIGLWTCLEYILGIDQGFDRLFFSDSLARVALANEGRMSAATAIAITASGVALLNLNPRGPRNYRSETLALVALAFALISILGFAYGAGSLYSIQPFRYVSLNGAISLTLLSTGILFANEESFVAAYFRDPGPSGILVRRLGPAAILVPSMLGYLCWKGQHLGLFDPNFGLTLFAISNIAAFCFFVWWSAVTVAKADAATKETEKRLGRQREHLELALETGEIGAWDLNLRDLSIRRTKRFDQIFGDHGADTEFSFTDLVNAVHPDDKAQMLRSFEKSRKNRTKWDNETRIILPSGKERTIWLKGKMIEAATDGGERMSGVVADVTALRKAEAERHQIFERITDAFVAVDRNFDFTYVNPKGAKLLSKDAAVLIGKNMWEVFPEGLASGFKNAYERAIESQQPVTHEEYYPALGIWIEIRAFPSADGLSIYFHDVSERRAAEQKIRELNETLEQRVADRTREMESVNKELESFSYSVSHDLRAPLRAIDGFSAAVIEDAGDSLGEEARGYLARVRGASRHMGQLIDDLLKLSRVSRAPMKADDIDLTAMAEKIFRRLRDTEATRDVKIEIEPGLKAIGDEVLTRSIMENLINNAWKFTSKRADASISVGQTTWNGQRMFYVKDNGAGFDQAYRDKLFGAFQRLHSPAEFEGTGIGLATVQRIVNRHGGTVDAVGEVNKGAVFYFSLGNRNGNSPK